jgi:hypothetical protein
MLGMAIGCKPCFKIVCSSLSLCKISEAIG